MNFGDIEQARGIIGEYVPVSRLTAAASLAAASGSNVYLKLESEGPTFAFKARGGVYCLWRRLQQGPLPGVVTASSGNHGAAIAFAALRMGIPATVFLPENPNPAKKARIIKLGARVIEVGRFVEESRNYAAAYAKKHGFYDVVDGLDEGLAIAAGTIGCEIIEQRPEVEIIYVPVGDSSFIRGLAFAAKTLKPAVRIVGVQTDRAPAYYRSWVERRTQSAHCDTIVDGLATREPRENNVREMIQLVDHMQLVSDDAILRAVYHLLFEEHVLAEPAGAATSAALLADGDFNKEGTVVLLVSGGNISSEILGRIVSTQQSLAIEKGNHKTNQEERECASDSSQVYP